MSIEINGVTKEDTAYDKWVHFTYEGEQYHALLHWDMYDGFDLAFTDAVRTANWVKSPDWVWDWEGENEESLEFTLDQLTDEVIEASY